MKTLLHLSCLPTTTSFILVALGCIYPFVQKSIPCKCSLCNGLLVRFKASSFNTPSKLGPTNTLALPLVGELAPHTRENSPHPSLWTWGSWLNPSPEKSQSQ